MAVRQYIGARYVPTYYENSQDPTSSEWEPNVRYDPLTIVSLPNMHSYQSKKMVPANIGSPAQNPEYWYDQGYAQAYYQALQDQIDDMNDGDVEGSLQNQIDDMKDGDVEGSLQNQIDDMKDGDVEGSLQNQIDENSSAITALTGKTNTYITAEEFGAVGDNVADDTQALQNAINYASANGVVLKLKAKTYKITSTLNVPSGTKIVGATTPQSFQTTKTTVIKAAFSQQTLPMLNLSNNDYTTWRSEPSVSNRTEIYIKDLLLHGNSTAFCGIKMRGYDIIIEDVAIFYTKIGVYCYNCFVTYLNRLNVFFCEIGLFTDQHHPNSTIEKCYFNNGSSVTTINDLSSIVTTTFGDKLSTTKICGIYAYNSTLTVKNTCIEEEYYAVFLSRSSRLFAETLSIESIVTGGACFADYASLGPNYIKSVNTHMYTPANHGGSIALPAYRSVYYIYSDDNKPENFADPVSQTRGILFVKFRNWMFTYSISINNMTNPTIAENFTHFDEDGDLIVDFVLRDYDSQNLSNRPSLNIGNLSGGFSTRTSSIPIIGTDLYCLTSSRAIITRITDVIVALPKMNRYYFKLPYEA